MDTENKKRWFISNFLHTESNQTFALRNNKLSDEEVTRSHISNWSVQKYRNKRFDFTFFDVGDTVVIVPQTPEAEWSRGIILTDKNGFRFVSGKPEIEINWKGVNMK